MEVTGHTSVEGVQSYKWTSDTMEGALRHPQLLKETPPRVEPNTAVAATLPSAGTTVEPLFDHAVHCYNSGSATIERNRLLGETAEPRSLCTQPTPHRVH